MTSAKATELRRSRRGTTRKPAAIAALVVCIIVILVAAPQAQQAPAFSPAPMAGGAPPAADVPTDIDLLVGRSTVLNVGSAIARVSLTVPDIADAMVTAPTQLLIHGKQPGTISLFVWDRAGSIKTYEVKVRRDLTALVNHLKQLFPGEPIEVRGSGKDVVVSGTVSSKYVMEKAGDIAGGYVEKKENVVNLLRQQEGVASNQVMLKVRFAEVSRSALQELGGSFVANGFKNDWYGRTTTQQFSAPDFDSDRAGGLVFSDFLNVFVFNAKEGLGGVVRALQNKGLFQSLAEPNLIASNGKEASFLAGGEFPYPVVQGGGAGSSTAVTIMFKEFGIRLTFTPTVLGGDLIQLKVKPEVSALDFANGVVVSGFRVPALTTRRTETEVELQNGQTFAIAGLMNNTLNNSMSKIPGIGDIPILGLLFRSKAHQKNQTELVVMITPTIVRRGSTGVSEGLPSLVEPYMGAPAKTHPNPTPWIGSPRYPANQPAPRSGGTEQSAAQPSRPQPQTAGAPTTQPAAKSAPAATQPATPVASQQPAARPVQTQPAPPAPKASQTPAPPAVKPPPAVMEPAPLPVQTAPQAPSPVPQTYVPPAPAPLTSRPIQNPGPPPGLPSTLPVPGSNEQPQAEPSRLPGPLPVPSSAAPASAPSSAPPAVPVNGAPGVSTRDAAERKPAAAEDKREAERRKAEARAEEKRRAEDERRRAEEAQADVRRRAAKAEAASLAKVEQQKKDEEARKLAEKLDKERAKREADVAKKNADSVRKRAEEDQKREKALAEAAARLKEAQSAYQSQLEKGKGSSNDKTKERPQY